MSFLEISEVSSSLSFSWDELIVNNPKTMKRFKLKLTAAKDKSLNIGINDLERSERNYQNAIVSGIKFDEVAVNMMTHLGPSLKTLELLNVKVKGLIIEFFAPLVNLEQLTIKSCEFHQSFEELKLNANVLSTLKSVVFEKSDLKVSISSFYVFVHFFIFILFSVAGSVSAFSSRKVATECSPIRDGRRQKS